MKCLRIASFTAVLASRDRVDEAPSSRPCRAILSCLSEALALELVLQPVDGAAAGQRVALLERLGAGVDLVLLRRRRRAGCAGRACSWVSHGLVSSSGGRAFGLGGLEPRIGFVRRAEHARGERHEVGAAGGQHAEPLAVGVTRAALAGEAGERLRRLGVDGAAGRELLVLDLVLRPRQDDLVLAARQQAVLLARTGCSRAPGAPAPGPSGAGRRRGRAARPRRPGRAAGARAGSTRRAPPRRSARPGRRSRGEGAQRRERLVERAERGLGGAQRPRQLGDRECAGCRPRARTRRRSC